VEVAPDFRVQVEAVPARCAPPPPEPGHATRPGGAENVLRTVQLLSDGLTPQAAVERYGHAPLPPYIRREDRESDRERYQTVYAREPGSVAAPTAGLHFTPELLSLLGARGVERAEVVLHVGPGTFRPVEVEDVREHRVDPERYVVPPEASAAVDRARAENRRVLYVPPWCAHGFCVLSEEARVAYSVTEEYSPELERGILWSDPALAISWPVEAPIVSPKDQGLPLFAAADLDAAWPDPADVPLPRP